MTINVYHPPRSRFTPTAIPTLQHPSLSVGDFKCQHVNWGYSKTSDGESLDSWVTANNRGLLYNSRGAASFSSHRWNVGTNPDLAFASFGQDNRLPDRYLLGTFRRSQHQSSVITPPRLKVPTYSDPVKSWNFPKAECKRFLLLTDEFVERLPRPDTTNIEKACQEVSESLLSAAKQCIPRAVSARTFIAPSSEPRRELTLIEPLSLLLGWNRRSRSDGKKLLIP